MKDSPPPNTRPGYDAAFRIEALRLAGENRSTQWPPAPCTLSKMPVQVAERNVYARGGGHCRRVASVAGWLPSASEGAGHVKISHRQRLLEAQALADTGLMSRYRFIEAQRGHYPVRRLC